MKQTIATNMSPGIIIFLKILIIVISACIVKDIFRQIKKPKQATDDLLKNSCQSPRIPNRKKQQRY